MLRVITAIDLASRFSAVNIRIESDGANVDYQEFDSRDKSAIQFCGEVAEESAYTRRDLEHWVVAEDVPYGVSGQGQIKNILRLQGILINELSAFGLLDKTVFVNPSTWQRSYPGVSRGPAAGRIEAARVAALALGYEPPDLVNRYILNLPAGTKVLKKNTNPLAKNMTDYIDSRLMVEWASKFNSFEELTSVSGVQPVYL